jgi:hypothetical protein
MKKRGIAALFAACALSLAAQSGGGGADSFSTGYVPSHFTGVTINEYGDLVGATKLIKKSSATLEEKQIYGGLDGNGLINTTAELLAMASVLGIQEVKQEDALKLYAEIAMEGAINKFLGVTGTTHDQVLDLLKATYNFTDSQIAGAIHAVIDPVVDKYYNKRELYNITPSAVYAEWKRNGVSHGLDGLQIVKDKFTAFYLSPTKENFAALRGIFASYRETEEKYSDPLAFEAGNAFSNTVEKLNYSLWDTMIHNSRSASAAIADAGPAGRDLGIFSLRYTPTGGR